MAFHGPKRNPAENESKVAGKNIRGRMAYSRINKIGTATPYLPTASAMSFGYALRGMPDDNIK